MERFTIEEENLICIFDTGSRASLIEVLNSVTPHFEEPELQELTKNTISKLGAMTDFEFDALEFIPAYDEDEETEEINV